MFIPIWAIVAIVAVVLGAFWLYTERLMEAVWREAQRHYEKQAREDLEIERNTQ